MSVKRYFHETRRKHLGNGGIDSEMIECVSYADYQQLEREKAEMAEAERDAALSRAHHGEDSALAMMKERDQAVAEREKAEEVRDAVCEERNMMAKRVGELEAALRRGGLDLCPCRMCGAIIACIPDGLPFCEGCCE